MPSTLRYFRESALAHLKQNIEDNLEGYLEEGTDWESLFEGRPFRRPSSIEVDDELADSIQSPAEGASARERAELDGPNSIAVYNALRSLTPQQATHERIWAYLAHFDLQDYVRRRWPVASDDTEAGRKRAQADIRAHYFVSGGRGLLRDNGVSRLWWMGWIAHRCIHFSEAKALEILLYRADVRANLLERSSFGMSPEIFNGVMKLLGESYETDEKALFGRAEFRGLMKLLNRSGGRIMLNALSPEQLDDVLQGLAGRAIQAVRDGGAG